MVPNYDFIQYETEGRIARITLDRPEKLNALSHELRSEVFHAMREAANREAGVIILRAAGRAFSAGCSRSSPSGSPSAWATSTTTCSPTTSAP